MSRLTRRSLIAATLLGGMAASAVQAQEKIAVVATFSILGDLVKQVGGDRVGVTTLVGPDADAHVYAATPADAKAVGAAKIIVLNGLKFEGWFDRLLKSSNAKGVQVIATRGVATIKVAESQGVKDKHGHDHSGKADPHAWQDVKNVRTYVANIRDGLIAADPAGKASYEANAASYIAKLDALDAEIKAEIGKIPAADRKLITSHDAFSYFAKAYGVTFLAPVGVSTEAEASAKDVANLIRQAKAQKVKAIFLESFSNPKLAEQISRETGARLGGRLYSDALTDASGPAATYIDMMRHNIRELSKALTGGQA